MPIGAGLFEEVDDAVGESVGIAAVVAVVEALGDADFVGFELLVLDDVDE